MADREGLEKRGEPTPATGLAALTISEKDAVLTVAALGNRALTLALTQVPPHAKELVAPAFSLILGADADSVSITNAYQQVQFRAIGVEGDLEQQAEGAEKIAKIKRTVADLRDGLLTIPDAHKMFCYEYPDSRTTLIIGEPNSPFWFEIDLSTGTCTPLTDKPVTFSEHFKKVPKDFILATCAYPDKEGKLETYPAEFIFSPQRGIQVGSYKDPIKDFLQIIPATSTAPDILLLERFPFTDDDKARFEIYNLKDHTQTDLGISEIDGKKITGFIEGPGNPGDSRYPFVSLEDGRQVIFAAFEDGAFIVEPLSGKRIKIHDEIPLWIGSFSSDASGRIVLIADYPFHRNLLIEIDPSWSDGIVKSIPKGIPEKVLILDSGELLVRCVEKEYGPSYFYKPDDERVVEILIPDIGVPNGHKAYLSMLVGRALPKDSTDGAERVFLWINGVIKKEGEEKGKEIRSSSIISRLHNHQLIPVSIQGISTEGAKLISREHRETAPAIFAVLNYKYTSNKPLIVNLHTDAITDLSQFGLAHIDDLIFVGNRQIAIGRDANKLMIVVDIVSGRITKDLINLASENDNHGQRFNQSFFVAPNGDLLLHGCPKDRGYNTIINHDTGRCYTSGQERFGDVEHRADGSLWAVVTEYVPDLKHRGFVAEFLTQKHYPFPREIFKGNPVLRLGPDGEIVLSGESPIKKGQRIYFDAVVGSTFSLPKKFKRDGSDFVFLGQGSWAVSAQCPASNNKGMYRGSGLFSRNRILDSESV